MSLVKNNNTLLSSDKIISNDTGNHNDTGDGSLVRPGLGRDI